MVNVLIDSTLVKDSMGRDYIIDKVIKHLEKSKKCHSYVLIEKTDLNEAEELFGDNVDKRIHYSWFKSVAESEPILLISPDLDKMDKKEIDFKHFENDSNILAKPDII